MDTKPNETTKLHARHSKQSWLDLVGGRGEVKGLRGAHPMNWGDPAVLFGQVLSLPPVTPAIPQASENIHGVLWEWSWSPEGREDSELWRLRRSTLG